jgi:hypothetical protein
MMRVLLVVLALLVGHLPALPPQTALAQPAPAQAPQSGKRVALVVGIGGYQYQSRLQATPKDARDMGALLQGLGFTLTTGTALVDPDKRTFDLAVRQFQRDATGAEMAVFYFSGHGMQIDGRNWMIPTDGRSSRPSELVAQHVGLHEITTALERAQPKLSMLILDACRNNPNQATRAGVVVGEAATRSGLASVQAPAGTVVAFATAPDTTAADGPPGGNSPYTAHLMTAMRTPGLDIFRVFNTAAVATRNGTNGQQQPWVSFSPIDGDFYFVARGQQAPTPVPVANAPPRPAAPQAQPQPAPQQQQQAALPPPQQGERNASFTLVNLSGRPINDLRASLDTDTNWGTNRISRGQQLGDRKTIGVTLPAGSCKADLRLVPEGGDAVERRGLETCRFTTMVVFRDMSVSPSNPDVAIINNTGRPIVALYASLTSETSWGRTRGNLAPGARVQVSFQQGAGCTVDIRAEFADGQPMERRRIDTCSSDEYVLR